MGPPNLRATPNRSCVIAGHHVVEVRLVDRCRYFGLRRPRLAAEDFGCANVGLRVEFHRMRPIEPWVCA